MMPTTEEIEAKCNECRGYARAALSVSNRQFYDGLADMLNQIAQSLRDAKTVGLINAIGGFTFYVEKTETFPESWRALYDIPMPTDDQPTNPREVSSKLVGDERDAERYKWLRDVGDATWTPLRERYGYKSAPEVVDAAIDAAMRQSGEAK